MPWKTAEARNTWLKKYRAENKDRIRARDRVTEQKWREEHREEARARQRKHRLANIEQYREYNARWHRDNRANHPEKVRAMHLKSAYGITLLDYERLLLEQGGHCKVCLRTPDQEKHGVLHVDHNHSTGAVRGLLCHNHNTALGLAHDSPEELQALAAYANS